MKCKNYLPYITLLKNALNCAVIFNYWLANNLLQIYNSCQS